MNEMLLCFRVVPITLLDDVEFLRSCNYVWFGRCPTSGIASALRAVASALNCIGVMRSTAIIILKVDFLLEYPVIRK